MTKIRYAGLLALMLMLVPARIFATEATCSHTNTELRQEVKACSSEDGSTSPGYSGDLYCKDCGALLNQGHTVAAASNISVEDVVYNGRLQTPAIEVTDTEGQPLDTASYTVEYADNKAIGRASVKITLAGAYSGQLSKTFLINPRGTSLSSITAKRKGFEVSWKEKKKNISGYQLEYSTRKSFSSFVLKNARSSKTTMTVDGLKGLKDYYVRIRTYMTVDKIKYYSEWSEPMKVTTCKYLIVIDPGHQRYQNSAQEPIGPGSSTTKPKVASGTSGVVSGLHEYELTLMVSKRLAKVLRKRGYEVVLVRTTHDVDIANSQRAAIANELEADAFVRIHANGALSSSVNGAQTICMTSHNPYNSKLHKKSYKLSECILDAFVEKTGCHREYVSQVDNMSGINWCKVPVTIIEMGYMTNPTEDAKMATSSYQKKMAQGIANGLDAYFKK